MNYLSFTVAIKLADFIFVFVLEVRRLVTSFVVSMMLSILFFNLILVLMLTSSFGSGKADFDGLSLADTLADCASSLELSLLLLLGKLCCFLFGFQRFLDLQLILQIRILLNRKHLLNLFYVQVVLRWSVVRAC